MTSPLAEIPTWEYRLDAWDPAQRHALGTRLDEARVPYVWRDTSVRVPSDRRGIVDSLVASIVGTETGGPSNAAVVAPSSSSPPPSWYPDPWHESPARWWDGSAWTGFVTVAAPPERPWIPPRGDRTQALAGGGIAFGGFVAAEVTSLVAVLVVWLLGGSVHGLAALCASQAALWACLFGACKLAVRRHGSGSLRDLGLAPLSRRQVGSGALVGVIARFGAGALAVALTVLFSKEQLRTTAQPVIRLHHGVLEIVVMSAILVIGAPFFEELFFRGLVQGAFTNRFGARAAMFGQAVCFGLVHYQVGMTTAQAVITVITIGATGCLFGSLRWHSQKLGPGMVAHALFNAVVVAVLVLT